ncbi:ABC transporter ATP-binding protein, partial [Aldersonia kunmingensis]|uniref:ABC transporter ATP-binding protein n=1 Tax=Aldersonia kunmingensis TaxID=408066 RepID=UPI0008359188
MTTKARRPAADGPAISGPLRPIELATGAVLGAVSVTLAVVASVLPFAAALNLLAAVPMGMVAHRHRVRALITATVASVSVAFVAGGLSSAMTLVSCAVLGGIVGQVKRRGRGFFTAMACSLVAAVAFALFAVGMLLVFANSRALVFDTIRDTLRGLADIAGRQLSLTTLADGFTWLSNTVDDWWWLWVGSSTAVGVMVGAIVAWFALGAVLDRLAWLPGSDHLDAPDDPREVAPLPVRLDGVCFRYPGAQADALSGIKLHVDYGEFVAVVGHNGSGKSTLTRILAGRPPTTGTVNRPGAAGLGQFGGTAVVLQRPETQTLGVLVADDVVWGLPPGAEVDIEGLLREVGLGGMGQRETSSLSGGQMQRLAVAAALARRPSLLIADEATSMVDPAGRAELVALLAGLPARHRMAVVLVTHQETEAAAADRVIHLAAGRMVDHLPDWSPTSPAVLDRGPHGTVARAVGPLLRLEGVRHTYLARTPWATEALHGVDLTVERGRAFWWSAATVRASRR